VSATSPEWCGGSGKDPEGRTPHAITAVDMTTFAYKRLAAVEIEPDASHQHELNAGTLRRALGFPEARTRGLLSILAYLKPEEPPDVLDGEFTLYDARENHPTRSEYRMYYQLPGFAGLAKAGDLLVLCRAGGSGGLLGILARPGTPMESQLAKLLDVGDYGSLRRFFVSTPAPGTPEDTESLAQTLLPLSAPPTIDSAARSHYLFAVAVAKSVVPPTKQMAQAGREIAEAVWGSGLGADEFISRGLEAESELYFAIEREVGTQSLHTILEKGPAQLEEVFSWALRFQQSRKSRRGQSLQHHFGFLLDRDGVPYTAQCVTERGETPDFVIPGSAQYHNPAFPADRLRMVACKSTVRERWGQILKEADRIPEKYLLTMDEQLSGDVLHSMAQVALKVFLPQNVIAEAYCANPSVELLGTVGELLASLREVL
jgi:hypothetical protein